MLALQSHLSGLGGNHISEAPYAKIAISRIGHLLSEVDYLLKQDMLFSLPAKEDKLICKVLINPLTICNPASLRVFPPSIRFIECAFPEMLLPQIKRLGLLIDCYDIVTAMYRRAKAYSLNAAWGNRESIARIPAEWVLPGEMALKNLGLPDNVQYVCIHARTGGYSPRDEHLHSLRNSNIDRYGLAIQFLNSRGFYVIRMGDSSMPPLQSSDMVIDYAHSKEKADWLDLYISSKCHFFLTGPSGAGHMAAVFGRPIVLVNGSLPFSFSLSGSPNQVGIPKLLINKQTGRAISFSNILRSPLGGYRLTAELESAGVVTIDNTPEDLLETVTEMCARLDGTYTPLPGDTDRQALIHSFIPENHYTHGTASICGASFLAKHERLLL